LTSIVNIINRSIEEDNIYGNICYKIKITETTSEIYCYDEFLGKEATRDILNMLNDLTNHIALFELQNGKL
jgi:hypothetical protein